MTRSHLRAAAFVLAVLGLDACAGGRGDRDDYGAGIQLVPASEQTRAELGVFGWDVQPLTNQALAVSGIDERHQTLVELMILNDADGVTIEARGTSEGRIVVAQDGVAIESTLSDVEVIDAFVADGQAALAQEGFRHNMACMQALMAAAQPCGAFMNGDNSKMLACAVALADVGSKCFGGGMGGMTGGGMTGGGMTGGGMTGGDGESGGNASGESGGESGYGESGYGESGYGESGYGESGYGESGYGESGGYEEGGYEEGGYEEGGYEDGGYGEGGYGEGGYGGYDYSKPDPRARMRMHEGAIPTPDATIELGFTHGGTRTEAPALARWHLVGRR